MPQLRFNEDGEWHDFELEGGVGLKAGPWFPYLLLYRDSRLSDHRVNRPRPVKGAGMKKSLATPSAVPASGSVDAAEGGDGDSFLPTQNKAQHDEAGGFK